MAAFSAKHKRRLGVALWVGAGLSCASSQQDAELYRSIVRHSVDCKSTASLAVGDDTDTTESAARSMGDLRACLGLVYRPEVIDPVLKCMAEGPCDAACPAQGTQELAPLPAHREVRKACEAGLRRCKGRPDACESLVHALLPLTAVVCNDVRTCFERPCEQLESCVTTLPGIAGGVRVASCMLERARAAPPP